MKACPKCQTNNHVSSRFCKKCGFQLSNASFQDKKEKVLGVRKNKRSWIPISLTLLAILLGGTGYWLIQKGTTANAQISSQPKVSGGVSYTGKTISMTDVQAKVENGKISIPFNVVLEKRLVRFEYKGKKGTLPLLAYITPSGRVVTAVSMCEPCRSTRFHIKGKTLVCNACYTEWDLETLKGVKGGCLDYPPDPIPSSLENGLIVIDEKDVVQWKPRV